MKWIFTGLFLLAIFAGCKPGKSALVGTWKGVQKKSNGSGSFQDAAAGAMGNLLASQSTVEFSEAGTYKWSVPMGVETGKWVMHGDLIDMNPDPSVFPVRPFKLKMAADGKTLSTEKQFDSDPAVELEKIK